MNTNENPFEPDERLNQAIAKGMHALHRIKKRGEILRGHTLLPTSIEEFEMHLSDDCDCPTCLDDAAFLRSCNIKPE